MDAATLELAMLRRTITAGSEQCELNKSVKEAEASRDALAKAAYERLFDVHTSGDKTRPLSALATKPRCRRLHPP